MERTGVHDRFEVHKLSREERIKLVEAQRKSELAALESVEGKDAEEKNEAEDEAGAEVAPHFIRPPKRLEKLAHIPKRPILEELKLQGFASRPAPWERNGKPSDPLLAAAAAAQLAK